MNKEERAELVAMVDDEIAAKTKEWAELTSEEKDEMRDQGLSIFLEDEPGFNEACDDFTNFVKGIEEAGRLDEFQDLADYDPDYADDEDEAVAVMLNWYFRRIFIATSEF